MWVLKWGSGGGVIVLKSGKRLMNDRLSHIHGYLVGKNE